MEMEILFRPFIRKFFRVAVGRLLRVFRKFPFVMGFANYFPSLTRTAVVTLEDLDAVLDQAGSFEEFAANSALVNLYFTELQNYFGRDRFSRLSFNKIFGQMRSLS